MIDALTGVRGLAAAWVVLYHFGPDLHTLFPWTKCLGPFARQGYLAVDLFFILSGFVLSYNYFQGFSRVRGRQYLGFLYMRLARIYPVHLAALLAVAVLWVGAKLIHRPLTDAGYTPALFALNLGLFHAWTPQLQLSWNYPSWSISCEWFAYLWFPFICALLHRVRGRATLAGLTVVALAAVQFVAFQPETAWFRELMRVSSEFVLGCVLFQVAARSPVSPRAGSVVTLTASLAVAAAPFIAREFLAQILLIVFTVLVLGLGTRHDRLLPWLKSPAMIYLGEVSYSLYMTHTLAQKVLYVLLPASKYAGMSAAVRMGVLGAYVVTIALVAVVSYHAIERPARGWMRGWAGKRPPSAQPQLQSSTMK